MGAAMSVNLLCDKCEIERKNLAINIQPETFQENIKSKINQSKTENTIDEKVKVEEENVLSQFKNECENQFMECNDKQNIIVTTSYESSQKRKRNENPIIEEKQW